MLTYLAVQHDLGGTPKISDGITPQIVVSFQLIQHLVIVVVALNQKGLGWKLSIVAGMIGMASQA